VVASGNGLVCGSVLQLVWGEREIRRKTLGSLPDDFHEHPQKFRKATITFGMPVRLSVSIEQTRLPPDGFS